MMNPYKLEKTCSVSLEEGKQRKQASRLGERIQDLIEAGIRGRGAASYVDEAPPLHC